MEYFTGKINIVDHTYSESEDLTELISSYHGAGRILLNTGEEISITFNDGTIFSVDGILPEHMDLDREFKIGVQKIDEEWYVKTISEA